MRVRAQEKKRECLEGQCVRCVREVKRDPTLKRSWCSVESVPPIIELEINSEGMPSVPPIIELEVILEGVPIVQ